jgi:hypothetical protein
MALSQRAYFSVLLSRNPYPASQRLIDGYAGKNQQFIFMPASETAD